MGWRKANTAYGITQQKALVIFGFDVLGLLHVCLYLDVCTVCVCVSVTFFNQLFSVVIVFLFKIMCASRMRGGGEWRRSTTEKAGL